MNCAIPNCTSHSHAPCDLCDRLLCPAHCHTYGEPGDVCCAACLAIGEPYRERIRASLAGHERTVVFEMDGWRGAVCAGAEVTT